MQVFHEDYLYYQDWHLNQDLANFEIQQLLYGTV